MFHQMLYSNGYVGPCTQIQSHLMKAEPLCTESSDDVDADGTGCQDSKAYHKGDSCMHAYVHSFVDIYA